MTKNELIAAVAAATEHTQVDTKPIIEATFAAIKADLENGSDVRIPGFGTFKPTTTAARVGRNPKTGSEIQIPEKRSVKFKPSSEFSAELN